MYLTGEGFVGIGQVRAKAVPAKNFRIKRKSIFEIKTLGKYDSNKNNLNKCQYIARVKWIRKYDRNNAIKASGKGFNLRGTLVPISKNSKMIQFINKEFGVDLDNLANT